MRSAPPALLTLSPRLVTRMIRSVLNSLLKPLLLIAVMISCGIGSSFIQISAWITMVPAQWLQTGSLEQTIENTMDIDGSHACSLCKVAAVVRAEEQSTAYHTSKKESQKSSSLPLPKDLGFSSFRPFSLPALKAVTHQNSPVTLMHAQDYRHEVPTPPPQGFLRYV